MYYVLRVRNKSALLLYMCTYAYILGNFKHVLKMKKELFSVFSGYFLYFCCSQVFSIFITLLHIPKSSANCDIFTFYLVFES